jgi:hypothetical protein
MFSVKQFLCVIIIVIYFHNKLQKSERKLYKFGLSISFGNFGSPQGGFGKFCAKVFQKVCTVQQQEKCDFLSKINFKDERSKDKGYGLSYGQPMYHKINFL